MGLKGERNELHSGRVQTHCLLPDQEASPDCPPNRFYAYGVISRLALLAAAIELANMAQEPAAAVAA